MIIIDTYPGIKRIALLIAYDNGLVNAFCPEEEWLSGLDDVMGAEGVDQSDLVKLDAWCVTLTDEEAETLAYGEQKDTQAIIMKCPQPELCGLFDDIFES